MNPIDLENFDEVKYAKETLIQCTERLSETVEYMNSDNYEERFKAEYYQLKIRIAKLKRMVHQYRKGKLDFEFKSDILDLENQVQLMEAYLEILQHRAISEDIYLKY